MFQLLAYICCELDCYLDELKGNRRGSISSKRRVAIFALFYSGVKLNDIAQLLNKDRSSLNYAIKKATSTERALAENLLLNFSNWQNRVLN